MDLKPASLKRYGSVLRLLLKYRRPHQPTDGDVALPDDLAAPSDPHDASRGHDLAADLESLGPTFIKLGQLLSSRSALIPPAYAEALERLQDEVDPIPFGEVEPIVVEQLGVRLSKAFAEFEPEPLASASLGQVHRARLRDGRPVAVKVQRPGIRERILKDLDAFQGIAGLLEKHTSLGQRLDLQALLEEFRKTILAELDYRREAANLDRLADNLAGFRRIVVPRPVQDYSTSLVLTMDYVPGRKVTKVGPLAQLEADGPALVEELFQAYLQQILVDGFFHADPHPGNVFLTEDNRLALLDLGMVARVSPRLQDALLKLVLAIAERRGDEAAEQAWQIAERHPEHGESEYRRRVASLVAEYAGQGIAAQPIGKSFLEIVRVAVDSGVVLPPETALLGKTLYYLESTARVLAPSFDPTSSVRENAARLLRQRMLKSLSPGNLASSLLELREFADRLPGRLNRLLDAAATNQLGFKLDTGIDAPRMLLGFQKVANRITMGLVLAALIVGAAMLMQVETRWRLFGYPGLAIVLFLLAAAAGLVLLLTIATQDRKTGNRE